MEKQKFLMEMIDIANGQGKRFEPTAFELIKEAIRSQAKGGTRVYNIPMNQMYISVNGVNIFVSEETLKNISSSLKGEGFDVDEVNGYYNIKW